MDHYLNKRRGKGKDKIDGQSPINIDSESNENGEEENAHNLAQSREGGGHKAGWSPLILILKVGPPLPEATDHGSRGCRTGPFDIAQLEAWLGAPRGHTARYGRATGGGHRDTRCSYSSWSSCCGSGGGGSPVSHGGHLGLQGGRDRGRAGRLGGEEAEALSCAGRGCARRKRNRGWWLG
jgi:hypothetical protein